MIPEKIGRYLIKAELGRGGMSTVYLAHDPLFDRDVAVKLLPLELSHQGTFRKRFEREAKVVAGLEHIAIVPVYDFGEENGQPFLVMRFMPGGSLAERLNQGALPPAQAAEILCRLAPALDEVNARGVVHRDLKPSNILFDQRGHAYISDFGTVKMMRGSTRLTNTGGAVGTPAYMSPEQIQGELALDGRSDIYTLGIILFEMLTGKHPYQTNTPIAVAVKHMFEPVPRMVDLQDGLPAATQEIVGKAVAKQRDDRFPTAVALAEAFQSALEQDGDYAPAPIQLPEASTGRRMALIIANSEFQEKTINRLLKPTANAYHLQDVLRHQEIGGFHDVTVIHNESAAVIRRAISHFFAQKEADDLLLLYVIGHAVVGEDNRLYLAAADTEADILRGTAVTISFIVDEMDHSQSNQQVLILDCYFSQMGADTPPTQLRSAVNTTGSYTAQGHERVILTANDTTQYNLQEQKSRAIQPSLFTHYFIEGIKTGAADADRNGRITVDEIYAYIQEQLGQSSHTTGQKPRKWVPFTQQNQCHIVLANCPKQMSASVAGPEPLVAKVVPAYGRKSYGRKSYGRKKPARLLALTFITLLLLTMVTAAFVLSQNNSPPVYAAVTQTTAAPTNANPTAEPTRPANLAIATEAIAAPTAVPTTPKPTPASETTTIATVTATAVTSSTIPQATTLLASSIFNQPDSNAQELAFLGVDEPVDVLGRAAEGDWFYVQNGEGIQGFVFAPRLEWAGDFAALPEIKGENSVSTTVNCSTCPALWLDIYPLPNGRCDANGHYKTIFMRGQGGNGAYTYYWNNAPIAGPLTNEGVGFEIHSPDGSAIIGTGKVVSGDSQTIEKELFISDFTCN
jgi:serine/threonine-protein kinase